MPSIKTAKGREKMAKAHAGQRTLPAINRVALGSGGVNPDGTPKSLTGNENTLFTERIRKTATVVTVSNTKISYRIVVDATADNLLNVNINEACLIDAEGDLVAIKTFTNKGLESGVVIEFDYDAEY